MPVRFHSGHIGTRGKTVPKVGNGNEDAGPLWGKCGVNMGLDGTFGHEMLLKKSTPVVFGMETCG